MRLYERLEVCFIFHTEYKCVAFVYKCAILFQSVLYFPLILDYAVIIVLQSLVCVNQSYHILKLVKWWKNLYLQCLPKWVLFQVYFKPQQKIGKNGRWASRSKALLLFCHFRPLDCIGCSTGQVS